MSDFSPGTVVTMSGVPPNPDVDAYIKGSDQWPGK